MFTNKILVNVCRIILALTFVFSGFVKSVDPWGFAIKIGEYLTSFNLEAFSEWKFAFSILLSGAEMLLGFLLLFRVRLRWTSLFVFAIMTFFTLLTLIIAIWNPVEDCGCFGDAIKLSNWGTFIKNIVLWPMALLVFWRSRRLSSRPAGMILPFAVLSFGIGIWSYAHLPIIDFLPYKKGVNLREEMHKTVFQDAESVVVVRDLATGEKSEFDVADTTWYDTSQWEYLDMRNARASNRVQSTVRDFALIDAVGNIVTDEILDDRGTIYMVCAADFSDVAGACRRRLEAAILNARETGARVICLTAEPLDGGREFMGMPCYNMDAATLKTMLRARVGVVILCDGVIIDKKNCRDI